MKRITLALVLFAVLLTGCSQADTASRNLSSAADNFEVVRRIVFYNGITGEYILTIEGLCSLGNYDDLVRFPLLVGQGQRSTRNTFSVCRTT